MKKLLSATLVSALFLAACSDGEENTEESTEEATAEEAATEESSEESTEEESTEEESGEGAESDADAASDEGSSEDLAEAEIDEEDMKSAYDLGEDKADMIDSATETDQSVEDVLQAPSEVTSYQQETAIMIEVTEGEQVLDEAFTGNRAQIDETEGTLEVASDYIDESFNVTYPHGYANSETGEVILNTDRGWTDYSAQYGPEELVYGTYSTVYEIIEQMPESLQVKEAGNYDLLYYTGDDEKVHQLYQKYFQVEFTGANMEELETGFVAFINKESSELESVNLIASAPGEQNPQQKIKVEIILNYSDYGAFDDTEIKKPNPDEIVSPSTEDEGIEGSVE
ncbi:hypothetical protein [Salinicoccus halodurans]|uniref:Lipoprotein n=1 Tax=Salinicoccus halodurans TaxID=407035 RepID=A0A0F7HNG1_9STAP|nr:hypothetical protein [Salinicoccus halodurans]AKG74673.1 hypothetical protein AAT16_11000 [Salinicoccus halodurans]SFK88626.1 hypothetical protein SAMN05216235_2251 [Salinicoccus halodurans]